MKNVSIRKDDDVKGCNENEQECEDEAVQGWSFKCTSGRIEHTKVFYNGVLLDKIANINFDFDADRGYPLITLKIVPFDLKVSDINWR
jgi:hypothetical protein